VERLVLICKPLISFVSARNVLQHENEQQNEAQAASSAVDAAGLGGIAGFNEGNSLQDRATVSALLRRVINHQGARGVPFSSARRGAFGGGPDISPAIGSRAYFFVTL